MTGGAVEAAPGLCKEAGCGKPVKARRMCGTCYARWSRANPGLRVHLLNMEVVEEALPSRETELIAKTGLGAKAVGRILARLQAAGRARIGRWDPPRCPGSRFTPVWVAGKGKNARRPGKQVRQEHSAAVDREYQARRRGSHQPPPVACWTDALGTTT